MVPPEKELTVMKTLKEIWGLASVSWKPEHGLVCDHSYLTRRYQEHKERGDQGARVHRNCKDEGPRSPVSVLPRPLMRVMVPRVTRRAPAPAHTANRAWDTLPPPRPVCSHVEVKASWKNGGDDPWRLRHMLCLNKVMIFPGQDTGHPGAPCSEHPASPVYSDPQRHGTCLHPQTHTDMAKASSSSHLPGSFPNPSGTEPPAPSQTTLGAQSPRAKAIGTEWPICTSSSWVTDAKCWQMECT